MRVVVTFELHGCELAVTENLDALIGVLDSGILEDAHIDIKTTSEEEFEK